MSKQIASIIGATGMIGTYLQQVLTEDSSFDTIRILVRRPIPRPHPKIEVKLVDFSDLESVKLAIDGSDSLFCAIGTTQKKVKGDRQAYLKIDFDIPVKTARLCKELDIDRMAIVSAVGANSKSRSFYLKLKGHVEDAISLEPIASIHFFQPSVLLGNRQEKRMMEKFAQRLMRFAQPVMQGGWRKYRAIEGLEVAQAMVQSVKLGLPGIHRYTYSDIQQLAASYQPHA